ncbi:hypothetical protein BKA83DRAFT_4126561 [Pisolithus microcarpus]|nr:hypothetical protein BKA83DRAFT_4126561 [Pisolithus microcarpus]
MDSGKLPNYRSSYMYRFHPYARAKPSARELVMAALYATDEDFVPSCQTVVPDTNPSGIISQNLHDTAKVKYSIDASQRKLTMSTLVVDLALLMCRKPPPTA